MYPTQLPLRSQRLGAKNGGSARDRIDNSTAGPPQKGRFAKVTFLIQEVKGYRIGQKSIRIEKLFAERLK